jgi:rhamnosyltransferase
VSRPAASIVIRCYNEVEHIGGVLDTIAGQSMQDFEIVVVDSGSTDGTLDVVAGHDVELVHIEKEDFSFGRSLNMGCARARMGSTSSSSALIATPPTSTGSRTC